VKTVAALLLTTLFFVNPKSHVQSPIETMAREMLTNFVAGRFDFATSDFNDALKPIVTPAVLAQVKGQIDHQVGRFIMVNDAHEGREEGFRTVGLDAKFEKGDFLVVVSFDPLDRIGAVHFNPILEVDPKLEAIARTVLDNFTAGRYEEAAKPFDAAMSAQLPPASMVNLATNVANIFGTFQSVTEVHQRTDKELRTVTMTLSYTKGIVAFRVTFDRLNRVSALQIAPYRKD
jgi:hypothetical protein